MIRLRDYQSSAVEHCEAGPSQGKNRGYFVLPTGSGKTPILAQIAKDRLPHGSVLFIAHRQNIVDQAAVTLRDVCSVEVGTAAAGVLTNPNAPVLVGMVQTLCGTRLRDYLAGRRIGTLLYDECHHAIEDSLHGKLAREVVHQNPDAFMLGATATPWREGRDRFQDVLPHCFFERTIEDMQKLGILAPLVPVQIPIDTLRLDFVQRSSGDYQPKELDEAMCRIVATTAKQTLPHIQGRLSIAFAVSVDHARTLADEYRKLGHPSYVIVGETPRAERERIYNEWETTRGVLCGVDVFSEGWDRPSVSAVVMAAPTQAVGRYLQRVGRATRKAPGKSDALILDVTGSRMHIDDRQAMFDTVFLHGSGGIAPEGRRKPGPRKLLASPADEGRNHWLCVGGIDVLPTGGDTFWSLVRDPSSGLWTTTRHKGYRGEIAASDALLSDALQVVASNLPSNGLTRKNAGWRTEPASESSLAFLEQLDPRAASVAREQDWDQGVVSDAIGSRKIARYLRVPRVAPRPFIAAGASA